MSGHHPKTDECACCYWKTDALTETDAYARTRGHGLFTPDDDKEWTWLCDVCRSTAAGNMYLYPDSYDGSAAAVASTICWGINAILSAVAAPGYVERV